MCTVVSYYCTYKVIQDIVLLYHCTITGYVVEGLTEDVDSSIVKEILTCVMVSLSFYYQSFVSSVNVQIYDAPIAATFRNWFISISLIADIYHIIIL